MGQWFYENKSIFAPIWNQEPLTDRQEKYII
jgi:hypothetical protein